MLRIVSVDPEADRVRPVGQVIAPRPRIAPVSAAASPYTGRGYGLLRSHAGCGGRQHHDGACTANCWNSMDDSIEKRHRGSPSDELIKVHAPGFNPAINSLLNFRSVRSSLPKTPANVNGLSSAIADVLDQFLLRLWRTVVGHGRYRTETEQCSAPARRWLSAVWIG